MNANHFTNPMRPTAAAISRGCMLAILAVLFHVPVRAAEVPRVDGLAPPNHDVLRHTRGGAIFIARDLKRDYDSLLDRVRLLQAGLQAERITGADARLELRGLQEQLEKLRQEIETKKVPIVPVKVHEQSETTTFEPGPERLLVITADNIEIEGWDGPTVKCVLEKTVLAADDKPVEEHLTGLKVVHQHGRAPNVVGRSAAERDAEEAAFLASPDGLRLTAAQRASRQKFLDEIAAGFALFADFQGKEIDTIEIEGLTHEQGNRQITVGVSSQGGGGSLGSDWQRHATLTVYVPRCQAVALRGCLAGLQVDGLQAPLILTQAGSRDRDYNGRFEIRNVHGPLTVDNVPLDLVEGVHGDATIMATTELANTGTNHQDGWRTAYTPPPRELTCRKIDGSLTAWFTRGDLRLSEIGGQIDVRNEFGDTTLTVAGPLADAAHRVLSNSGRIEVQLAAESLRDLPVLALTNCGTVRTNAAREVLDETSFSTRHAADGGRRDWRGVKSTAKGNGGFDDFFAKLSRLDAVLAGQPRASGLDLISRAGAVVVRFDR